MARKPTDHTFVRSNRVDERFVDRRSKKVLMVEMSCPRIDNRNKKETEKTEKYVWISTTVAVETTPMQDTRSYNNIECHHGCTWRLVQGIRN